MLYYPQSPYWNHWVRNPRQRPPLMQKKRAHQLSLPKTDYRDQVCARKQELSAKKGQEVLHLSTDDSFGFTKQCENMNDDKKKNPWKVSPLLRVAGLFGLMMMTNAKSGCFWQTPKWYPVTGRRLPWCFVMSPMPWFKKIWCKVWGSVTRFAQDWILP